MNSLKKRTQTTKGIWITGLKNKKLLIIDCEGTDSINRNENDREKFEKCSSLFSLAITNLLIINMWVTDVGRYTASNYGVLKTVFEMNFKLFNCNCLKKIILILRDFDNRFHNFEKITKILKNDISNIWDEVKKPENYENKKIEDFFIFEFMSLSNYIYERTKFENEINELKIRFNNENNDYIFNNIISENIPCDGLGYYIFQIWNEILNEKDLDIPTQREMVSNYRCQEIKMNILKKYENELDNLNKESSKKNLSDFKNFCINLRNNILNDYDESVSYYDENVKSKIREELDENISKRLYSCFLNQSKKLILLVQNKMRNDLENKLKNFYSGNYFDFAFQIAEQYSEQLLDKLEEKKVYENWNLLGFTNLFDEIIENQKEKFLKEKKNSVIESLNNQNNKIFNSTLENYNGEDFWKQFNISYSRYFFLKIFNLRFFLLSSFKLTNEQLIDYLTEIEKEVYENLKKECLKKSKEIYSISIDLFKNRLHEKNIKNLSQEQIYNLYKQLRMNYLNLFEQFKLFKVVKNINQLYDFNLNLSFHEELIKGKVLSKLRNNKKEFENLMNQGEIIFMKKRFDNGIQSILESIMRKKNDSIFGNMPYWFIGLLIFFGINNILRITKSIFFIPTLLFIGFYYSMIRLGKENIIRDKYFDIEFSLMKQIIIIKNFILKYLKNMNI